jgi:peroxiredoxin
MDEPLAFPVPPDLPKPVDDGACRHLAGQTMPPVTLPATDGRRVDLAALISPRTVLYCYPMTGVPGTALPAGWDSIPGARGCTPESCAFRDHYRDIRDLDTEVFGVSTQTTAYQEEMAARLHLPFAVLSDSAFALTDALRLPTFAAAGQRLVKRLTLVVHDGVIEHVFYPVFPPDRHADEVIGWLARHPLPGRP